MEQYKKTIDAGRIAMIYKGEWDDSQTYTSLDTVTYNGESYCARKDSKGKYPDNEEYWFKIASKGDNFKLSGVVNSKEQLPTATQYNIGELYGVLNSLDNNNSLEIYLCTNYDGQGVVGNFRWISIGTYNYSQKIYTGKEVFTRNNEIYQFGNRLNENEISFIDNYTNDNFYYIGDIYLKYDSGEIFRCIFSGSAMESTWQLCGASTFSTEKTFQTILLANNWEETEGKYIQTIENLSGLSKEDKPIISLEIPDMEEEALKLKNNWSFISKIDSIDNGLKAICFENKPDIDLPIIVKVYNLIEEDILTEYFTIQATAKYNEQLASPIVSSLISNQGTKLDFEFPVPKINIGQVLETNSEGKASVSARTEKGQIYLDFVLRAGDSMLRTQGYDYNSEKNILTFQNYNFLPIQSDIESSDSDFLTTNNILSIRSQSLDNNQKKQTLENISALSYDPNLKQEINEAQAEFLRQQLQINDSLLFEENAILEETEKIIAKDNLGIPEDLKKYMLIDEYTGISAFKVVNRAETAKIADLNMLTSDYVGENATGIVKKAENAEKATESSSAIIAYNLYYNDTSVESQDKSYSGNYIIDSINSKESKKRIIENIEVDVTNNFQNDNDIFPYTILIDITNQINNLEKIFIPEVFFDINEALSGNYASIVGLDIIETVNGKKNILYLYAKELLNNFTIPMIILWEK